MEIKPMTLEEATSGIHDCISDTHGGLMYVEERVLLDIRKVLRAYALHILQEARVCDHISLEKCWQCSDKTSQIAIQEYFDRGIKLLEE